MGLSQSDYQLLLDNVDIIFHVAASVRFNDPLAEAIKMNTIGTNNVVELGLQLKNLLVFMHVSTAYCYCHSIRELDEEVFPLDVDWRTVVNISQKIDPATFEILGKKFTGNAPNSYVYTKALAEQLINDYKDRIPAIIFRPTIVISSWKEPMAGWIDNFNGPIGLIIAAGKGVIRSTLCNPDAVPDYMAVDVAIKAMIIAAWKTGISRGTTPLGEIEVYNSASTTVKRVSNSDFLELCRRVYDECPFEEVLWTPSYNLTSSKAEYKIRVFFSHYLIALVADSVFRLFGKTPMLLKIHIKIHNAMMALSYFTMKEWSFKNKKFRALNDAVLSDDKNDFDFNFDDLEPYEYLTKAARGGKKYLLNEDLSTIPSAKKKAERLFYLDKALKLGIFTGIAYYAYDFIAGYWSDWLLFG